MLPSFYPAYSFHDDSSHPLIFLLAIPLGLGAGVVSAAAPIEKSPIAVSNPPPVQLLVPGFTVRELPLALRNLNNLVYAPDGRLFALGYDGNVYQLKDTDGDGLEDASTLFSTIPAR